MRVLFVVFFSFLFANNVFIVEAQAKTRLAVSTFEDKKADTKCTIRWYSRVKLGTGFRDQLVTKLMDYRRFSIQERQNLKKMYKEEHELINSDKNYAPKKNRFKAAHFSITGAVTSFELCNKGGKGKVDVGGLFGLKKSGLKLGAKHSNAKVGIDIRIVNVETGEVFNSFKAEGTASSTSVDIDGDVKGAEFGTEAFNNSPLGEALEKALADAASKINDMLPDIKDEPKQKIAKTSSGEVPSKMRGVKSRSKIMAANGAARFKYVCPGRNDFIPACKPLKWSKSGKKVQVLNLIEAEKSLIDRSELKGLVPAKKNPEIGADILIHCKERKKACGYSSAKYVNYGFQKCVVTDQIGDDLVVNCRGRDLQVNHRSIYFMRELKTKKRKVAKK